MEQKNNADKNSFAKECIFVALKKLLHDKNLQDITISEIASVAGVARSTFYRNYTKPMDVINEYFELYPMGAESAVLYSLDNYDLKNRLTDGIARIKKDRDLYEGLVRSGMQWIIYDNFDRTIKSVCAEGAASVGMNTHRELTVSNGIYYSVCYEWIRTGMKESVEELASAICAFMLAIGGKDVIL